ncbi:hypothetical protein JFT58_17825 [Pseudomonas sp. MF6767]|uniref:hypothetical protein n=1 Tax=Pseudomonas sp. MF6767 TaxID=2797531 RepID=UPI0018E85215|nr:hypothetical protein [Pseudomonas sp. MF6767]MBJ2280138.1 hypothetical protein [Pseudomonas sp. MF6767]
MEFLFGAVVAGIVIFFVFVKKKTDDFNKLTRLNFPIWLSRYYASQMPETIGMARAFILQTFHLAEEFNAITPQEKKELDEGSMKEDPMRMLNEWIETTLPTIESVFGGTEMDKSEARMIGVLMLVALKGVNPEGGLRAFLQQFNH